MEENKNRPAKDPLPVDPGNTRGIGQNVEQEVIKIKEDITEQSAKWEDEDEKNKQPENYLKHPSPEENKIAD